VAQNVLDSKHKGKQIWQNPGSLMIRVPWFKKTKKKQISLLLWAGKKKKKFWDILAVIIVHKRKAYEAWSFKRKTDLSTFRFCPASEI